MILLDQSRGDDPHDPLMPFAPGQHQDRRQLRQALNLANRIVEDAPFDILALAVQFVKLRRYLRRVVLVVGEKQSSGGEGIEPAARLRSAWERYGKPPRPNPPPRAAGHLGQRPETRARSDANELEPSFT